MNTQLFDIKVSSENYHLEPLQQYVQAVAKHYGISDEKCFQLSILIEEVFVRIVRYAYNGEPDHVIQLQGETNAQSFVLRYMYKGIPFAYDPNQAKNEEDKISLQLIRTLSTSYKVTYNGKDGQTIEMSMALPSSSLEEMKKVSENAAKNAGREIILATDATKMRLAKTSDLKSIVRCLYEVFGYNYSAASMYSPDDMAERMRSKVYKGIVCTNTSSEVVAHIGMVKANPDDTICESGMAFVSPQYGKRGLFSKLKQALIEQAAKDRLRGVFSSAVTSHPFTQQGNNAIGCIETGMEISYIPADLQSVVSKANGQRQAVMNYFKATAHTDKREIYIPLRHRQIIEKTYNLLNIKRTILQNGGKPTAEHSEYAYTFKVDWDQSICQVSTIGKDFELCMRRNFMRGVSDGMQVFFLQLSLSDPAVDYATAVVEKMGFSYSGVMPYELHDADTIHFQYIVNTNLNPDLIVTVSDWGKEIKEYAIRQMHLKEQNR